MEADEIDEMKHKQLTLDIWEIPKEGYWEIRSWPVKVNVKAGTLRQALVKFANALKRIKNKELEEVMD